MPAPSRARVTHPLIASDRIEGTLVCRFDGTQLGTVERLMINKISGQVAYAVLSFGGFLGIGNDSYPIPWAALSYDTSLGGYRTTITEQQLKGAPKYQGESWDWEDYERRRNVYDYYNTPWIEH